MTDWSSRTVVTTVKQYCLPSPTNWAQVRQILAAIDRELSDQRRWDDTVKVEAVDDEIVFSYLVETRNA